MVTYFDEKHCREYGCIYYDPDVILCCKRNFKDPVDGMDACCEPPAVQDDSCLLYTSPSPRDCS